MAAKYIKAPEGSRLSTGLGIIVSDGDNLYRSSISFDTLNSIIAGSGVDHTLLLNIGTNTHAQIDTHIADATKHFTEASISITESQVSDLGTTVITTTGGQTIGGLTTISTTGNEIFKLKGVGVGDGAYTGYYKEGSPTRVGYIGYVGTSVDHLYVVNETANGNIALTTQGTGEVQYNGNEVLHDGGGQTITGALTVDGLFEVGVSGDSRVLSVSQALGGDATIDSSDGDMLFTCSGTNKGFQFTPSGTGRTTFTGTGDANGAALTIDDAGSMGIEIQSTSPTIHFKEDDTVDTNYQIRVVAGDLLFQTQNDARTGAATQVTFDSAGDATFAGDVDVTGELTVGTAKMPDLGEYTVAGLPTASTHANMYALATDASGGRTVVRSDGTNWKVIAVEGATVTV